MTLMFGSKENENYICLSQNMNLLRQAFGIEKPLHH